MPIFDAVAAAAYSGRTVRPAQLAWFDFKDAPMRVHPGWARIRAGGFDWEGVGTLSAISEIEAPIGGTAPTVTFTMSGVPDVVIEDVKHARERVKGRACRVYLQFYDDELAPLGPLVTLYRGRMDRLVHTRSDANTATAKLTVESAFALRGLMPFGNLTDRDQQRLFPGDTGLIQVPAMQQRSRPWNPVRD